jgi:hypothetical protein
MAGRALQIDHPHVLLGEEEVMKNFRMAVLPAACLALAISAGAQERYPDRLFWQVRDDLNRVEASSFPFGHDRKRLDHTRHELNELQEKFDRGRPDRGELNDVIGALTNVVADNRMRPRDRDLLNQDLHRLYEFRDRHERWRR